MEGGGYAQASDIEIHANELIRMREWLEETLAHHTGRDIEQVRKDIERDKILTAQQAQRVRDRRPGAGQPQGRRRDDGPAQAVRTSRPGSARADPADVRRRPGDARDTDTPTPGVGVRLTSRPSWCAMGRTRPRRGAHERRTARRAEGDTRKGTDVARIGDGADLLKCSFCGKSQKQVKKLIAGPGVYICDECIELCNEIIEEELAEATEVGLVELPKPKEIFDFLEQYIIGQESAKRALVGRGVQPLQADPGR